MFCSGAAPPSRSTSTQSSHANPTTTTVQSNDASWLGRVFNSGQAADGKIEQAKSTDAGSFKPIQQDFNVPSDGSPAKHRRYRKSGRTIR